MSKQVEVPESALEALRDAEWAYSCSPVRPDRDSVEWAEMRLQVVLPLLYKHFSDRLLEDESVDRIAEWLFGEEKGEHSESVRTALRARLQALQAISTPEVDRG